MGLCQYSDELDELPIGSAIIWNAPTKGVLRVLLKLERAIVTSVLSVDLYWIVNNVLREDWTPCCDLEEANWADREEFSKHCGTHFYLQLVCVLTIWIYFGFLMEKYETKYLCKQIVSTSNNPSQRDRLFHVFQTKYLFIRVLVRSLKLVTCWKDILTSVPSWQTPWPWGPPRWCPLCPGGRPGWMSCPYCHNTSQYNNVIMSWYCQNTSPPPPHSPATHSWRNLTCSKWLVMMAEPPHGLGYKMLWISVDFWS